MSFASVLKKAKAGKAYSNSRDKSVAPIPDGYYKAHLKEFETGTNDKGTPFVKFVFKLAKGEHKNRNATIWIGLDSFKGKNGKGEAFEITVEDKLDQVVRILQALGIDTKGLDPEEVEEQVNDVIESGDLVTLAAKTKKGRDFADWKVIKVEAADDDDDEEDEVEDDKDDDEGSEDEDDDSEDDEDDEEEDDEDEDEDDEEEEDDEDDEDEPWEPTKGDHVKYVYRKKTYKWTVQTVSRRNETVTLKRDTDGRIVKAVAWDALSQ